MTRLITGEVSKPPSVAQRAKRAVTRKLRRTKSGLVGAVKHPVTSLKRFYGVGSRYSLAPIHVVGGRGRTAASSKRMGKAMAQAARRGATIVGPSPKAQKMLGMQKGLRRAHLTRRVATPVVALGLLSAAYRKKRRR